MLLIVRTFLTSFALAALTVSTMSEAQAPARLKLDGHSAGRQDTIQRLDYEDLAKDFLKDGGLQDWVKTPHTDRRFEEALDSPAFVRVELGSLDLRIPRKSLEQPDTGDEICATAAAMLEMEMNWFG